MSDDLATEVVDESVAAEAAPEPAPAAEPAPFGVAEPTVHAGPAPVAKEGPFLSESMPVIESAAPVGPRTSVEIVDGGALVVISDPSKPLGKDELHTLRRQVDAAFLEVS